MYAIFLGLRYLLTRWINLLCVVGVFIATWSVIVVVSVFAGFIEETLEQQRAGAPDVSILGTVENASFSAIDAVVRDVEGVAATAPRIVWFGLLYRDGERDRRTIAGEREVMSRDHFYRVIGIDWEREQGVTQVVDWLQTQDDVPGSSIYGAYRDEPFRIAREDIERNQGRQFAHDWPGMLLPAERAVSRRTMDPTSEGRGRVVNLLSAKHGADALATHAIEFVTTGCFESGLHEVDSATVFVDIADLRVVFGQDPWDEEPIDVCNEISVRAADGHDPARVAERVNEALQAAGIRGKAFTWQERKARHLEAINYERNMTKFVLFVLLVISTFLVFAGTSTMVAEKTRDIGVLSALGATKRGLLVIFMFSGMVIAILGSTLGIGLGLLTLEHLDAINDWVYFTYNSELFPRSFLGQAGIPYVVDPAWCAEVALGAILSSLLFCFLPAWRAARLDPVEALRYE